MNGTPAPLLSVGEMMERINRNQPLPLSAAQREQQRLAYVQAVEIAAHLQHDMNFHEERIAQMARRIDDQELRLEALERAEAVRRSSFMARARRWLTGR